jgi:hypothetical protein
MTTVKPAEMAKTMTARVKIIIPKVGAYLRKFL